MGVLTEHRPLHRFPWPGVIGQLGSLGFGIVVAGALLLLFDRIGNLDLSDAWIYWLIVLSAYGSVIATRFVARLGDRVLVDGPTVQLWRGSALFVEVRTDAPGFGYGAVAPRFSFGEEDYTWLADGQRCLLLGNRVWHPATRDAILAEVGLTPPTAISKPETQWRPAIRWAHRRDVSRAAMTVVLVVVMVTAATLTQFLGS